MSDYDSHDPSNQPHNPDGEEQYSPHAPQEREAPKLFSQEERENRPAAPPPKKSATPLIALGLLGLVVLGLSTFIVITLLKAPTTSSGRPVISANSGQTVSASNTVKVAGKSYNVVDFMARVLAPSMTPDKYIGVFDTDTVLELSLFDSTLSAKQKKLARNLPPLHVDGTREYFPAPVLIMQFVIDPGSTSLNGEVMQSGTIYYPSTEARTTYRSGELAPGLLARTRELMMSGSLEKSDPKLSIRARSPWDFTKKNDGTEWKISKALTPFFTKPKDIVSVGSTDDGIIIFERKNKRVLVGAFRPGMKGGASTLKDPAAPENGKFFTTVIEVPLTGIKNTLTHSQVAPRVKHHFFLDADTNPEGKLVPFTKGTGSTADAPKETSAGQSESDEPQADLPPRYKVLTLETDSSSLHTFSVRPGGGFSAFGSKGKVGALSEEGIRLYRWDLGFSEKTVRR